MFEGCLIARLTRLLSDPILCLDHIGVPNIQLVKENANVAAYYKGKSVAEQNSLDLSWELLMEPQFKELRDAIYCDESELTRFRSLLVNSVMAVSPLQPPLSAHYTGDIARKALPNVFVSRPISLTKN